MSEQLGFPEPLGDDGGSGDGAGGGPEGPRRGIRGRTIAIIVLAAVVVVLGIVIALLAFAHGSSGGPTTSPTPTATPTPTKTKSSTPTPTSTTSGAVTTCTVDQLSVTLGTPSGSAGSSYVPIEFTNTASSACELHGFPGVSFVGKGNGTQLGAAADWDQSKPIVQNTLQPGNTVVANLQVAQAGNYDSGTCQPLAADGFRVYPPHSTKSVFVKAANYTACQNDSVHLLTVISPVAPAQ